VREYTESYYLPAAANYHHRAAERAMAAVAITHWQHELGDQWANLRFGEVKVTTSDEWHMFEVQVYLNGIGPDAVQVELYAEASNEGSPVRLEMNRDHQLVGAENGYAYKAQAPAIRPSGDYTARIIPHFPGAAIPLEAPQIIWQR
jgi:starch phosphorylase